MEGLLGEFLQCVLEKASRAVAINYYSPLVSSFILKILRSDFFRVKIVKWLRIYDIITIRVQNTEGISDNTQVGCKVACRGACRPQSHRPERVFLDRLVRGFWVKLVVKTALHQKTDCDLFGCQETAVVACSFHGRRVSSMLTLHVSKGKLRRSTSERRACVYMGYILFY